jgi:hypothetical protein
MTNLNKIGNDLENSKIKSIYIISENDKDVLYINYDNEKLRFVRDMSYYEQVKKQCEDNIQH